MLCLLKIIIVHKVILECVTFYNSKIYILRVWSYKCVAWILWQKLVYIFVGHSSIPKIEYDQSIFRSIPKHCASSNISIYFARILRTWYHICFSMEYWQSIWRNIFINEFRSISIAKYLLFEWNMFELGILILSSLLYLIYCYLLKPTLSTKHFLNSSRITNIKNVYVCLNCHSLSPWNNTQYFFSEYQCFVSMASPFK